MSKTRTAVALVAATALGAALLSPGLALAAAEASKGVFVNNTASSPVPTTAVGTTAVNGSVAVSNLPTTQQVSGSVAVSNLPATQQVAGSVGITGPVSLSGPVAVTQAQPEAFAGLISAGGPGASTATTATYFPQLSFSLPAGKSLTARSFSAEVSTPSDSCTVTHVSLRRLLQGGATGPGLWAAATKVGPFTWVVNEESLLPDTRGIGAVVVCDLPVTGSATVRYVVTGDLVPVSGTP